MNTPEPHYGPRGVPYDDESLRSPICGQFMIDRLRGRTPDKNASRICALPGLSRGGYSQVQGGLWSPETDFMSTSSGISDSDKSTDMPSGVIQFHPEDMRLIQEDKIRRQTVSSRSLMMKKHPVSDFASSLSAIEERATFEVDDTSIASSTQYSVASSQPKQSANPLVAPQGVDSKHQAILTSMRELILKQQATLKEMSEENLALRNENTTYKKALQNTNKELFTQFKEIEKLGREKDELVFDVKCLRNKLHEKPSQGDGEVFRVIRRFSESHEQKRRSFENMALKNATLADITTDSCNASSRDDAPRVEMVPKHTLAESAETPSVGALYFRGRLRGVQAKRQVRHPNAGTTVGATSEVSTTIPSRIESRRQFV